LSAANIIEYFARDRIFQQRIDGEIPPEHVLARIAFKFNTIGPASVGIGVITTECGDFDMNTRAAAHQHHAEMSAHSFGLREVVQELIWVCICGDVVIFRMIAQEAVSNATAHKVSFVTAVT
jgi:hypothetical protein